MFLVYDLIFLLYALVYLPYLLLTDRGYAGYSMRFGFFPSQVKGKIRSKANIWLHAVSVGEVMVLEGFIDRLSKDYPAYQLVVTVTTKTGYSLALERLKEKAVVIPSPVDLSFTAGRFVDLIDPKIYIVVETEIWPNLWRKLYLRQKPIVVVNGRISDASFGRYKAIRFLLKGTLDQAQVWCMQSKEDSNRIIELGADPSRVIVAGNIKFDDLPPIPEASGGGILSGKDELWWVAGSTHPGEEKIVLDVYSKIIKDDPRWRLVLAPRHIDRVPQIIELIASFGFKAVKFTQLHLQPLEPDTVIVLNTIGQLRALYSSASLVFVGKSLSVGGGHNVVEPASFGKAIIIGPLVENFRDVVAYFIKGNAIVQVEDERTFGAAVSDLCGDPLKRENLGSAARKVVAANQGAARRSIERLAGFIR